jgi:hypothetical protein
MTELSTGLQAVINSFPGEEESPKGITIEHAELVKLLNILRTLHSLATNIEIEVRCLRDMEAGREAGGFVEDEATALLSDMLPAVDGNVVTPVFGRKS